MTPGSGPPRGVGTCRHAFPEEEQRRTRRSGLADPILCHRVVQRVCWSELQLEAFVRVGEAESFVESVRVDSRRVSG